MVLAPWNVKSSKTVLTLKMFFALTRDQPLENTPKNFFRADARKSVLNARGSVLKCPKLVGCGGESVSKCPEPVECEFSREFPGIPGNSREFPVSQSVLNCLSWNSGMGMIPMEGALSYVSP